jgi:septal ring factor EnvC (AmiA/AmiB activator)
VGVGLGLINDLNPVRYHRIKNSESDIEMGLLAQEVKATLAKHGLSNSGMVIQPDEKGYLYLRYNDLLAPMIRAIQELDDASEAKDEQIASLQQKLESQQEELLAIVKSQQEQIAQLQRLVEHQFASN